MTHETITDKILSELENFRDENGVIYIPFDLDNEFYDEGLPEGFIQTILDSQKPEDAFKKAVENVFYSSSYFDEMNSEEERYLLEKHLSPETLILIKENDFNINLFIDEYITFTPNVEQFKDQLIEVDILVDAGDMNYDFTLNSFGNGFYSNPEEGDFHRSSSLVWLCKQQGITENELYRVMTGESILPFEIANTEKEVNDYEKKLDEYGFDVFNHEHHKGKFAEFEKVNTQLNEANEKVKAAVKRYEENDISYEEFYEKHPNISKVPLEKFEELKSKCLRNAVETQITYHNKREELEAYISKDEDLNRISFLYKEYNHYHEKLNEMIKNEPMYSRQKFVESVINESANTTSHMNALTFLVKMSLGEAMEIQKISTEEHSLNDFIDAEERTGLSTITLSKNSAAGLYDPWHGAGGVFEIELVKDVVLPIKYISSANIGDFRGYSVNSIWGSMEYIESLVSIDKVNVKEIDQLINDAFSRSEANTQEIQKEEKTKNYSDKEL